MDQDETWHAGTPRPGHIVLDGDPAPLKGTQPPNFRPISVVDGWIKMPLGMEVGFGPGDFVLDGNPAPSSAKGGRVAPSFQPVYCGQTAGWTKMPLGMQVGLCPGDCVRCGRSSSLKRDPAPSFRPVSIVATVAHLSYC